MDDPNITMEEYIRIEEEKARKREKVFNWETAKYGRIWYDEDVHDLKSVENEFPAIVFIYLDNLKSDKGSNENKVDMIQSSGGSENTNKLVEESHDKINKVFIMRSFVMELNVNIVTWNHFVNEMLFNLIKNLYVPFSIPFDPKQYYKDGDCARMLRRPSVSIYEYAVSTLRTNCLKFYNLGTILVDFTDMAPLPPRDQRHLWLRYQVEGYTKEIVHDFEQRLETIFGRQVNRVHILDFEGLTLDMRHNLAERMRMVYTGDDGQEVFVSYTWRRLFGIRAPLVQEFLLEFFSTCRIRDEIGLDVTDTLCFLGGARLVPDKGDLSDYWVEISSGKDFLRGAPSYTYIRYPVRRLCHRLISYNISGRGQAPEKVTATDLFYLRSMDREATNIPYLCLAHHFGLVSNDRLRGLSVVAHELPLIEMEKQQVVAAGAPGAVEGAPAVDEGVHADPAPIQAPQHPPPSPPATGRTMPQRLARLEEEVQGLRQDVKTLRGLVERSMTDQGTFSTWMITCMTQLMEASGQTYQAFDETFRGSSPAAFQRRTRQRTDEPKNSAAP
ncbi:hypothetical protein Tco_0394333 [Tanacetum coccineum]